MGDVLTTMLAITPATTLALCAAYMATTGVQGWGWFLFAAVLICPSSFKYH